MAFPENLSRLQQANGETNYRLAKLLMVHITTVANWKNGVSKPQRYHLAQLAQHYGCTVDELLSEQEADP